MCRLLLSTILLAFLAACGTRGPLTLPPPKAAAIVTPVDHSSKPVAAVAS